MHNKLVVTIVDEKGSKQFQVHKHIKKIFFFGVIGFIVAIIVAFFFMRFLMHIIDDVIMQQNIAISEYRYIYQQNEDLKNKIQQKTNELNVIHQKIGDLEEIIGTQKNNQQAFGKNDEIDLQSLDFSQQDLILNLVPSGDPLVSYESKIRAFPKEFHRSKKALGIEYRVQRKTPVYATSDGVVEMIRTGYKRGFGNFLKLNHPFGFNSIYAHLDRIVVKRGEFVKKGSLIGYSGQSGKVYKPALYYEVSFLNQPLDTEIYTQWGLQNFSDFFLHHERIDWKSLVWIIQDILKLQDYQNTHYEKIL